MDFGCSQRRLAAGNPRLEHAGRAGHGLKAHTPYGERPPLTDPPGIHNCSREGEKR